MMDQELLLLLLPLRLRFFFLAFRSLRLSRLRLRLLVRALSDFMRALTAPALCFFLRPGLRERLRPSSSLELDQQLCEVSLTFLGAGGLASLLLMVMPRFCLKTNLKPSSLASSSAISPASATLETCSGSDTEVVAVSSNEPQPPPPELPLVLGVALEVTRKLERKVLEELLKGVLEEVLEVVLSGTTTESSSGMALMGAEVDTATG